MAPGRKVLPWTNTDSEREQERFIRAYLEGQGREREFQRPVPGFWDQPEDGVQAGEAVSGKGV